MKYGLCFPGADSTKGGKSRKSTITVEGNEAGNGQGLNYGSGVGS